MKKIKSEYKNKYNKAQNENRNGNTKYALELAYELLEKYPKYYFMTKLLMGAIYWNMNKLNDAIDTFKEIIKKSPNNEKISLCLFHVLWRKGLRFEALEEMKRFLKNNKSDEYIDILNGITLKLRNKPIDNF